MTILFNIVYILYNTDFIYSTNFTQFCCMYVLHNNSFNAKHVSRIMLKQVLRCLLLSYQPSQVFFWYDTDYRYVPLLLVIVGVIPKEDLTRLAHLRIFWYHNNKGI